MDFEDRDILSHERARPLMWTAVLLGVLIAIGLTVVLMVDALTGTSLIEFPDFSRPRPAISDTARHGATVAIPPEVKPTSDPTALRALSTEAAAVTNAEIPLSTAPNPAARAFSIDPAKSDAWQRSVECLTAASYYEAASEGEGGMRAVAQVVLNRLRHPAFPKTVCGVVFQGAERQTGCQFTFTCDGSLARIPSATVWSRARGVAIAALAGSVYAPVGLATHYHTQWVVPYWASTLEKNAVVGNHIFYRWAKGWGTPSAFRGTYAGEEPDLPWLAKLPTLEANLMDGQANLSHDGKPTLVSDGSRTMLSTTGIVVHAAPARNVSGGERWVIGAPAPAPAPKAATPAP